MPARRLWYPGAKLPQRFDRAFPGDIMQLSAPVAVLHTTEGPSWPEYGGGASAPTLTIRGREVRQHFPVNQSARALVNMAGGVQTNTQGAVQFELVGTCDPKRKGSKGWVYWPEADDETLAPLVGVLQWLRDDWGLKIQSSVKWVPYPASYGLHAKQRLTGAQWLAYEGILGHQHVPENSHGDPGNFPIDRLIALISGKPTLTKPDTVKPKPTNPSNAVSLSKLIEAFKADADRPQGGQTPGAVPSVKLVEKWLNKEGLLAGKWANDGSAGTMTRYAYAAWQERCGYRGRDADGIPGEASLKKLAARHGGVVTP